MSPTQRRGTPEIDRLEKRAKELGVYVSTHRSARFHRRWEWRVVAFSEHDIGQRVELRGDGNLGAIIAGVLDDWESAYAWTPEELLTVAVQSGLPVSRG